MALKNMLKYAAFIAVSILFVACGSSTTDNEIISGNDSLNTAKPGKDTKAQKVFNSIPTPIETTSLLKSAGAKYNAGYLNPIENVSKYSSVISKALNLGVYGSDLSFTSVFDQTQESMLYLRCTNKLASGLGISGAFDENTTSRIEANMSNRDSLLAIISQSYWISDTYLNNNGQAGVSSLIIAGGWIEGMYIATQIANSTANEDISARIGGQKASLDNLVALLEDHKTENTGANDILNSLHELKKVYDDFGIPAIEAGDKKNDANGGNNSFKLTAEQLKQITDKVTAIRNKIIQL